MNRVFEESSGLNVTLMVKGRERYVFTYSDENKAEVLRQFGRFASNPELSFNWYDAARLCHEVRALSAHEG